MAGLSSAMALLWIFVACLPVALGDQDGNEGIHVVSKESFLVERYDKNFMPAETNFEIIINTTQGQIKEFLKDYSRDSLLAKLNNVSLLMNYSMETLLAEGNNSSWSSWVVDELRNVSWKNYSDECAAVLASASQHQICDLPEATQMPFYMQAAQSIFSVLLNHFAFSRADLRKQPSLFAQGMSMLVLASFASRVYQDYAKGGAVMFGQPFVYALGWAIITLIVGGVATGQPTAAGTAAIGVAMLVFVVESLHALDTIQAASDGVATGVGAVTGFSAYACQLVQWSRAFDQLPTVLSAQALYSHSDRLHEDRQPVAACMGFLASIYLPLMVAVGPVLVVYGSLIFFYMPVIMFFVFVAVSRLVPDAGGAQGALLGDDQDSKGRRAEMIMKILLVPVIIYIQFVGEAAARYIDNEGWIESVYNTWAARTAKQYFCHFFAADAVTRALVFVGLM